VGQGSRDGLGSAHRGGGLCGTIQQVVDQTPPAKAAIVLVGGDLMHADNGENRTSKSHNVLDVDGRYPKVIATAERIVIFQIEAAWAKHKKVIVRVLSGNHDEHAAVAIAHYASA
jgi:hypothetical protein